MKCIAIYQYGGPEVLKYEEAPRPRAAPGEVVVRVHAVAINPVDWKIREGHLRGKLNYTFPLILGWDVSGVIETLGPGVSDFKVGDEVFSRPDVARDGGYAEFIAIRESELAIKPRSIDHIHAAALPLTGLTAWQCLFDAAALAPGQRVLIHAAAGGVGTVAVQLAKWKGAYVIGTASAANHAFVRQLGADEVIDYTTSRFEEHAGPVDVVLDTQGGEVQERSWSVLKPGGMLVSIAAPPSPAQAEAHGVRAAFVFTQPNATQLSEISRLCDAGKLQAIVETILPLAAAARGQQLSERGHTRGKIVLQVV